MKIQKRNLIFLAVFAAGMLAVLLMGDNPRQLLDALRTAKPVFLVLAGLCMAGYWLFESVSLYAVANQMKSRLRFWDSLSTSMVGQLFNCITPFASGGQPIQAVRLRQCGIPVGKASCILLAKFIVYQVVLTLYSLVLILLKFTFFSAEIKGFPVLILVGFVVNLVVVMLLVSVGFFPKFCRRCIRLVVRLLAKFRLVKDKEALLARAEEELEGFQTDFQMLKKNMRVLILPALISVFQLTMFFTVPYFICMSLGLSMSYFLSVISAAAFVLMISSFIPLPGGSGGAEGGFYMLFSLFFPSAAIVAITLLLWRVMTFYLPIAVGMVFTQVKAGPPARRKKAGDAAA